MPDETFEDLEARLGRELATEIWQKKETITQEQYEIEEYKETNYVV